MGLQQSKEQLLMGLQQFKEQLLLLMGLQQSKEQLLYQQVVHGNAEGIRSLRRDGAGLEWIGDEGMTPLIVACRRPDLLDVMKVLIDLGANVNAYRPGSHAGTPLHHAAKTGSVQTVEILLSHGANPLTMNDDCHTAVDVARAKGHRNVVRFIETRICIFAGWLRETHGPGILEAIIRPWVSRRIWAVVLPRDSRNATNRPKYELAVYSDLEASRPNPVISLWKVHVQEPAFNQADPALILVDKATKKRYKFLSENEGDKQQLQLLYNACKGTPQPSSHLPAAPALIPTPTPTPMPITTPMPSTQLNTQPPPKSAGLPQSSFEDEELAMAINASIHSAIAEGVPLHDAGPSAGARNSSGWGASPENATRNGWGIPDGATPSKVSDVTPLNGSNVDPHNGWSVPEATRPAVAPNGTVTHPRTNAQVMPVQGASPVASFPSAPPMTDETFYGGPIQYPSIDSSPVNFAMAAGREGSTISCPIAAGREGSTISCPIDLTAHASEIKTGTAGATEGSSISGTCVICLDAPAEGACIPCGHVAGCMSCLMEIREKKWGCPVCRATIDQVIRLYTV